MGVTGRVGAGSQHEDRVASFSVPERGSAVAQSAGNSEQASLLHTPNPGAKRYLAPGVTCPPGAGVGGLWKGKMS